MLACSVKQCPKSGGSMEMKEGNEDTSCRDNPHTAWQLDVQDKREKREKIPEVSVTRKMGMPLM